MPGERFEATQPVIDWASIDFVDEAREVLRKSSQPQIQVANVVIAAFVAGQVTQQHPNQIGNFAFLNVRLAISLAEPGHFTQISVLADLLGVGVFPRGGVQPHTDILEILKGEQVDATVFARQFQRLQLSLHQFGHHGIGEGPGLAGGVAAFPVAPAIGVVVHDKRRVLFAVDHERALPDLHDDGAGLDQDRFAPAPAAGGRSTVSAVLARHGEIWH